MPKLTNIWVEKRGHKAPYKEWMIVFSESAEAAYLRYVSDKYVSRGISVKHSS